MVREEPNGFVLLLTILLLLALILGSLAVHAAAIAWLFGVSFWRGLVGAVLLQGIVAALRSAVVKADG